MNRSLVFDHGKQIIELELFEGGFMTTMNCSSCGKVKDIEVGKTCEKGHFICKSCVYSGLVIISEKAYCSLYKTRLR